MITKLVLGMTIIASCAWLGMSGGMWYKKRVAQLTQLGDALNQLEFDIDFLSIPLEESIRKIGGNCEGGIRSLFHYIGERLENDRCIDMQNLWRRATNRFRDDLALTDDDLRILMEFSKNLGCGDRMSEKNNIKAALLKLKIAENEAREDAKRNCKMCRGLGLMAGVFIVIVLL